MPPPGPWPGTVRYGSYRRQDRIIVWKGKGPSAIIGPARPSPSPMMTVGSPLALSPGYSGQLRGRAPGPAGPAGRSDRGGGDLSPGNRGRVGMRSQVLFWRQRSDDGMEGVEDEREGEEEEEEEEEEEDGKREEQCFMRGTKRGEVRRRMSKFRKGRETWARDSLVK
eukprot:767213-Hanusia_phi.AAC.3